MGKLTTLLKQVNGDLPDQVTKILKDIDSRMAQAWDAVDVEEASKIADRVVNTLRKNYLPEHLSQAYRKVMSHLDAFEGRVAEPYPAPSDILKKAKQPDPSVLKHDKYRKGGVKKKPQMSHGGAYKGKKHTYAAGGAVKDMKIMRSK